MILDYPELRDQLKNADTVNSSHTVIAEWNMNKYQQISQYGLYATGAQSASMGYYSGDDDIVSGKTFYVYDDDDTKLESPMAEYFSSLASVFQAMRPDPGIILSQYFRNNILFIEDIGSIKATRLNSLAPRFYPYSENRQYDYFNSAKILQTTASAKNSGVTTIDGAIKYSNPFVVYEDSFPCNKIVIKVQNYKSTPEDFYVDILNQDGETWENIYVGSNAVNSGNIEDTGILEIYYGGSSTWTTAVHRVTDLDEITTPNTQLKKIKGLRLRVKTMTTLNVGQKKKTSLELIELSPRIEVDLSSYTEGFNLNSSIGDGDLGLPVGTIVTSNGSLSLSNDTKEFLLSSKAASYRMLTPEVEFRFYQNIYNESTDTTYTIPLKIMYADSWNIGSDFTAEVSISDKMKLMQDIKVMDLAYFTEKGVPFSVIILTLLDNAGITGFEFKKSNNNSDAEDIKIPNFYCNKEKTLVEVLEDIARATQCAMYIDAVGSLNVLTKERITNTVSKDESVTTTTSASTDFWIIFDENYQVSGNNVAEYDYISDYTSNVVSVNEQKITPITSGTIKYHTYGIRKQPGQQLIQESVPKELLEDIPANSLISTGYSYQTSRMWEPGSDNGAVLGAANLLKDINDKRQKDTFSSFTASAYSEEDAIRKLFEEAVSNKNHPTASTQLPSLAIYLDRNDAYMFPDYSGFVLIDQEYIAYRGIIYSINGNQEVLFSREELNEKINQATPREALVPVGLIIEPRFKIIDIYDNKYAFKVINDGRKQFNSKDIKTHFAFNENSDGVKDINKFSLIIGDSKKNAPKIGKVQTSTYYNFNKITELKKVKTDIGLPNQNWRTYLGYLKLAGPKGQLDSRLKQLSSSTASYVNTENDINLEVDALVPGTGSASFDPYVYTHLERVIYGQVIPIPEDADNKRFSPNLIATRMRLYSGRKDPKNKTNIASTLSSIAGIGFCLKFNRNSENKIKTIKSGYFLEVESIGSAAKDVKETNIALKKNLRFYRLRTNSKGELAPELLATEFVSAQTVLNADAKLISNSEATADAVFELEIRIDYDKTSNKARFYIYYGGQKIGDGPIIDQINDNENFWTEDSKNIFMFTRGDSQAIYEYVLAAQKPFGSGDNESFWDNKDEPSKDLVTKFYRSGLNPRQQYLFKDDTIKFYFNDFARLVRQVKKYDIRYESPALGSKLIDISRINPEYMILRKRFTPFGGEIVVVNTSTTVIALSSDFDLPLFVIGTKLEELGSGEVSISGMYEKIDDDGKNITDLSFNKSIYGEKAFSLDSRFIQTKSQAERMLQWIVSQCGRERYKFSIETYPNPLIELGDKIKVYSKDRGYREGNVRFGKKTFTVSEITYAVQNAGPVMNITLIEVGAK